MCYFGLFPLRISPERLRSPDVENGVQSMSLRLDPTEFSPLIISCFAAYQAKTRFKLLGSIGNDDVNIMETSFNRGYPISVIL